MTHQLGHYEIIKELGRGGMGVVYLAKDTTLDRQVAIKVLSQPISDDDVMVQRFLREARSAAALNHPNIVQVFFIGKEGDKHYFVMEYVKGETLTELIERDATSDPEQAAQIILQAACGLAAAHDRGIIHRDVKPSNLIIDQNGLVKIADFGIAFKQEIGNKLTATGQFLGTPGYLCPEICLGEPSDRRSDIFSLGIVFFEMLSGFSPFEADSPMAMMHKVVTADIPDISSVNLRVSDKLKHIVTRMVQKDRQDRYQDCHELQTDLEDYLGIRRSQIGTHPYLASNKTEKIEPLAMPPAPSVGTPPPPPAIKPAVPVPQEMSSSKNTGLLIWVITLVLCILSIGFLGWYVFLREKPVSEELTMVNLEREQADPEGISSSDTGELERSDDHNIDQVELESFDPEYVSATTASLESGQEVASALAGIDQGASDIDSSGVSQGRADSSTKKENVQKDNLSEYGDDVRESTPLTELQDLTSVADNDVELNSPIQTSKDLFRERPVSLPREPSVLIVAMGDDLYAEPLQLTLENQYQQAGYRVLDEEQFVGLKAKLEHAGIPLLALTKLGRKGQVDLVVLASVEPISELGIQYGSDYRNQGYRVNTISRIRVQGFFPKQNRPALNSWTKLTQYNADTAVSEAELTAQELAENWLESAPDSMDTSKFRVMLGSKGDDLVSEIFLHYMEKRLHETGYPAMNLNDYGILPGTLKMRRVKKKTGARVLVMLDAKYLSSEQIEAYGQWSELSTFRLKIKMVDLEAPVKNKRKQVKQVRFSAMSMDGDLQVAVDEVMPELLKFMKNL